MGSRTLSSRAEGPTGSPGRFRGRPHPVLLHQNAEAGAGILAGPDLLFQTKKRKKINATNLLTFFLQIGLD